MVGGPEVVQMQALLSNTNPVCQFAEEPLVSTWHFVLGSVVTWLIHVRMRASLSSNRLQKVSQLTHSSFPG